MDITDVLRLLAIGELNDWKACSEAADEIDRLRTALNKIAAWYDGELGPHMDEPSSAGIARDALRRNNATP